MQGCFFVWEKFFIHGCEPVLMDVVCEKEFTSMIASQI